MDTTDVLGATDIVPFAGAGAVIGATKQMARGAWGVYNYKQTYGRTLDTLLPMVQLAVLVVAWFLLLRVM